MLPVTPLSLDGTHAALPLGAARHHLIDAGQECGRLLLEVRTNLWVAVRMNDRTGVPRAERGALSEDAHGASNDEYGDDERDRLLRHHQELGPGAHG
jgi:hypothetical protein